MEFITVMIVMIAILALIVMAIIKIKEDIGKQIEKDIDRLVNVYDTILDKKSQELKQCEEDLNSLLERDVEEEIDKVEGYLYSEPILIQDNANYLESDFFKNYNLLKSEFHDIAYRAMSHLVQELSKKMRDINTHEFKELLSIFEYHLQYEMRTIDAQDQLEIIEELAQNSMGKRRILQKYLNSHNLLDIGDFMDYLRDYIFYNDSIVFVYSNRGEACLHDAPNNVVFLKDQTIGEGYIVRYKGNVYNFSLSGWR